jgi:hypothetical protein
MERRIWAWILVTGLLSSSLTGCYYFAAKDQMKTAEQLISNLKSQGGERLVPYEYCSAERFLELSRMEFDENDYKQSKRFADRARSAAEAGLSQTKKR